MIALKPEATYLYDTLMFLYFSTGQYNESLTLAEKIYNKDNSKLTALEIKAVSQQSLGLLKEALNDFESLNSKNKNVKYLYQIASLQYDLKRVAECSGSINQILTMDGIEKETVPFFGQDRSRQEVSIKAAAFNMRGVLAGELGENDLAIKSYEEALKIAPEFALAKNNLEVMKKRKEAVTKSSEAAKPAPAKK
jgi:tetratricopeptide (TPR) repeat protein